MIQIIVNNSYSHLYNSNKTIDMQLENLLSYESLKNKYWKIKNPHLIWIDTRKYVYKKKTHSFPTGLLSRVTQYFDKQSIEYQIEDKRVKPPQQHYWSLNGSPTLRYYQSDAMAAFLLHGRGTIDAVTASGKTVTMAHIVKELGVPTLVIVPSLNILNQTYDLFQLWFGSKYVDTIKSLKWRKKIKPIIIGNIQSIVRKPDEFFQHFSCIFVDECHHASAGSYVKLNKKNFDHIYYRGFVSGSPYRNDGTDLELFGIIGDIIYSYPATKAIQDGYIVPPHFFIHTINNGTSLCPDYFTEYSQYIIRNDKRNDIIKQNAMRLADKKHQVLIIVEQIEHGEILQKLIPESVYINGTMHSNDNKDILEQFNQNKFSILIATSVCGEGIDLPSTHALINAAGGKAKSEAIQRVGRVLRRAPGKEKAIVIDFIDAGTRWLEQHSQDRIKYYKMYETPITLL